ncbi:NHL repeat [Trinorchestia longiramus]|nr:NHL repeat [Trinorchestia longiramus]
MAPINTKQVTWLVSEPSDQQRSHPHHDQRLSLLYISFPPPFFYSSPPSDAIMERHRELRVAIAVHVTSLADCHAHRTAVAHQTRIELPIWGPSPVLFYITPQLEQLLTCCICLDRFRNPKLLPCQHSVCMEPCMEGLVDYVRRQVKCPECRAEHRIPYNGVQGFPSNVTLQRFLEAQIEITGETPDPHTGQLMERCAVCNEKNYLSVCAHCEKKVCEACKAAHSEVLKREIGRINNQVKRAAHRLSEQLENVERSITSLKTNTNSITEEIENISTRLQKAIRDRGEYLKSEVQNQYNAEMRHMQNMKEGLELEIANVHSNIDLAEKHMDDETPWDDGELMDTKDIFIKTMEFIRSFDYDTGGDYGRKTRFIPPDDLNKLASSLSSMGELTVPNKHQDSYSAGQSFGTGGLAKSKSDHRLAVQFREQEESYGGRTSPITRRRFGERPPPTESHDSAYESDPSRRRFRSRFMRKEEEEERVRFSEEDSNKPQRTKIIDTEDVSRGPLSGIARIMDSPRVIQRLQERDKIIKQKKEEASKPPAPTTSTTHSVAPTATAISQPSPYVPKKTGRQISEDEIDKIKKQNKADEVVATSSGGATATASSPSTYGTSVSIPKSPPIREEERTIRSDRTSVAPRSLATQSSASQEDDTTSYSSRRRDYTAARTSDYTPSRTAEVSATTSNGRAGTPSAEASKESGNDDDEESSEETESEDSEESSDEEEEEKEEKYHYSRSGGGLLGRSTQNSSSTSSPIKSKPTDSGYASRYGSSNDNSSNRYGTSNDSSTSRYGTSNDTSSNRYGTSNDTSSNRYGTSNDTSSNRYGTSNDSSSASSYRRPSIIDNKKDDDSESKYSFSSKYTNRPRANATEEESKPAFQSRFLNRSKSSAILGPDAVGATKEEDSPPAMGAGRARFEELKERRQRLARSKSSAGLDDEEGSPEKASSPSPYKSKYSRDNDTSTSSAGSRALGTSNSPSGRDDGGSSTAQLSNWARYLKNKYGNKSGGDGASGGSSTTGTSSSLLNRTGVSSTGSSGIGGSTSTSTARAIARSRSSHLLGGLNGESSEDDSSKNADATPTSPAAAAGILVVPTPIGSIHRNQYLKKQHLLLQIGSRGSEPGNFTWPRGVAVGPDNSIVVADSSNHRVQVFDQNGSFQKEFGSYGNGQGEFDCLAGVAVNRIGQYIIADRYNHRIQVFDPSGMFLRSFGSQGSGDGRFSYPWGVTTDALGFIYVCDKENHRIQVFQSDGTFVGKFGSLGGKPGQLEHPHYIAVSSTNRVIVSDSNNHRIQIFDINGKVQTTFGGEGAEEGQFKFPRGVAVDEHGYIIVADSGNNRIQVFQPDGTFLKAFGCWGSMEGEFKGMEGVAVMPNGNILVKKCPTSDSIPVKNKRPPQKCVDEEESKILATSDQDIKETLDASILRSLSKSKILKTSNSSCKLQRNFSFAKSGIRGRAPLLARRNIKGPSFLKLSSTPSSLRPKSAPVIPDEYSRWILRSPEDDIGKPCQSKNSSEESRGKSPLRRTFLPKSETLKHQQAFQQDRPMNSIRSQQLINKYLVHNKLQNLSHNIAPTSASRQLNEPATAVGCIPSSSSPQGRKEMHLRPSALVLHEKPQERLSGNRLMGGIRLTPSSNSENNEDRNRLRSQPISETHSAKRQEHSQYPSRDIGRLGSSMQSSSSESSRDRNRKPFHQALGPQNSPRYTDRANSGVGTGLVPVPVQRGELSCRMDNMRRLPAPASLQRRLFVHPQPTLALPSYRRIR